MHFGHRKAQFPHFCLPESHGSMIVLRAPNPHRAPNPPRTGWFNHQELRRREFVRRCEVPVKVMHRRASIEWLRIKTRLVRATVEV